MYRIGKLTEEGKEFASWQFDETLNLDEVRGVENTTTGEVILAIKIDYSDYLSKKSKGNVHNERTIQTREHEYKLFDDGYDEYLVHVRKLVVLARL